MSQFRKQTTSDGKTTYFDGEGSQVAKDKVPAEVVQALENQPEGTFITDDLQVVEAEVTDDTTEPSEEDSEEGAEDEESEPQEPQPKVADAFEFGGNEYKQLIGVDGKSAYFRNGEKVSVETFSEAKTGLADASKAEAEAAQPDEDELDQRALGRTPRQLTQNDPEHPEYPMGFPTNKEGKTLSIFGKKPHETIRYFRGINVPVTHEEYETKSDMDIARQLEKMDRL